MTGTASINVRFERWKGLNFVAMIVGTIVSYIISSNLPPSNVAFTATFIAAMCLVIAAVVTGARLSAKGKDATLREQYTVGTLITLMVVAAGSLAGQMTSLMQVLHHM